MYRVVTTLKKALWGFHMAIPKLGKGTLRLRSAQANLESHLQNLILVLFYMQLLSREELMNQELEGLNITLGEELLSSLLNTTPKRLQHYIEDPNQIPGTIDDRLRNITAIVRNLEGCYPRGRIKKFFENKNSKLGFKKPRDIMSGDWWPRDSEVLGVLMLSADMKG